MFEFKLNLFGNEQNWEIDVWGGKKFEFEFKGLEINNIGKSRWEEGNVVSRAQRSRPLLNCENGQILEVNGGRNKKNKAKKFELEF